MKILIASCICLLSFLNCLSQGNGVSNYRFKTSPIIGDSTSNAAFYQLDSNTNRFESIDSQGVFISFILDTIGGADSLYINLYDSLLNSINPKREFRLDSTVNNGSNYLIRNKNSIKVFLGQVKKLDEYKSQLIFVKPDTTYTLNF